jgi:chromate transporter
MQSSGQSVRVNGPRSNWDLFWTFNRMALRGFGGVLPVVERSLVHERNWLTPKEFVESLAIAQALPGPNVMNMAVMVGDRYSGLKGSLAAVAGMITIPMLIVLSLTSVYQYYAELAVTQGILRGMTAVSVGLIIGIGLRLALTQGDYRIGWIFGLLVFGLIGFLHAPLAAVILGLGIPACLIRWFQITRKSRD